MEEIGCKCQTFFLSLLSSRRKQTHVSGFPDSSDGKEPTCNAGDCSLIPGLGRSPGEGIGYPPQYSWTSLMAQLGKNPPTMRETCVWSLDWEDPLEKGKATHPSILAWRMSMGSQRIGHDWATLNVNVKKEKEVIDLSSPFSSVHFSHSVVSDSLETP